MAEPAAKDHVEVIARVAHEANRAYAATNGDLSHLPWSEAPPWQKQSVRDGVREVLAGNIESPRESHENWVNLKAAQGWTYGKVKDAEKQTHPCMVDFDDLPPEERVKDWLFYGIVRSMAAGIQLEATEGP